jgi:hypothetical protein
MHNNAAVASADRVRHSFNALTSYSASLWITADVLHEMVDSRNTMHNHRTSVSSTQKNCHHITMMATVANTCHAKDIKLVNVVGSGLDVEEQSVHTMVDTCRFVCNQPCMSSMP